MNLPRQLRRRLPAGEGARLKVRGFTLVELLVAMAILVLLTAMVLAAFQRNDTDRLSASARLMQSYIEGARSRAITDGRIRGVRLIRSANDTRLVDSVTYVGTGDPITGFIDSFTYDNTNNFWTFRIKNPEEWARLNLSNRNLIREGARIEIPQYSGAWYTLGTSSGNTWPTVFNTSTNVPLKGHIAISKPATTGSGWTVDVPSDGIPYRLELAPTPLPNQDPVKLDAGIVIDLDASQVPDSWRPTGAAYNASFDLLFDRNGNLTTALAADRLLHLCLCTAADVELGRGNPNHPSNPPFPAASPPATRTTTGFDWRYPFVRTTYQTTPIVMTAPRVGNARVSNLDFTDQLDNSTNTAGTDNQADVPYRLARRGREAQ